MGVVVAWWVHARADGVAAGLFEALVQLLVLRARGETIEQIVDAGERGVVGIDLLDGLIAERFVGGEHPVDGGFVVGRGLDVSADGDGADHDHGPGAQFGSRFTNDDEGRNAGAFESLAEVAAVGADEHGFDEVARGDEFVVRGEFVVEADDHAGVGGGEPFLASGFLQGQQDARHAVVIASLMSGGQSLDGQALALEVVGPRQRSGGVFHQGVDFLERRGFGHKGHRSDWSGRFRRPRSHARPKSTGPTRGRPR